MVTRNSEVVQIPSSSNNPDGERKKRRKEEKNKGRKGIGDAGSYAGRQDQNDAA